MWSGNYIVQSKHSYFAISADKKTIMFYSISAKKEKLKKTSSFNFLNKGTEAATSFPDYFPTTIFQLSEDGKVATCREYGLMASKCGESDQVREKLADFMVEFYKLLPKVDAYADLANAFSEISGVEKWSVKIKLEKNEKERHKKLFNSFLENGNLKYSGTPITVSYSDKYVKFKPLNHEKFSVTFDKKQGVKVCYDEPGKCVQLSYEAAFQYLENYLKENKKHEELYASFAKLLGAEKDKQRIEVQYARSYVNLHKLDHDLFVASFEMGAGITIDCYKDLKKCKSLYCDAAFWYLEKYLEEAERLINSKKLYESLFKLRNKKIDNEIQLIYSQNYVNTYQLNHSEATISFDEYTGIVVEYFADEKEKKHVLGALADYYVNNYFTYQYNNTILSKIKDSIRTTCYPIYSGEYKAQGGNQGYLVLVNERTVLLFLSSAVEDVAENFAFYPLSIFQIFESQGGMAFCKQYIIDMSKIKTKLAKSKQENGWPGFDFSDYVLHSQGGGAFHNLIAVYNTVSGHTNNDSQNASLSTVEIDIELKDKQLYEKHVFLWRKLYLESIALEPLSIQQFRSVGKVSVGSVERNESLKADDTNIHKKSLKKRSKSQYFDKAEPISIERPRDDSVVGENPISSQMAIRFFAQKISVSGEAQKGAVSVPDMIEDKTILKTTNPNKIINFRQQHVRKDCVEKIRVCDIQLREEVRKKLLLDFAEINVTFKVKAGLLIQCFREGVLHEVIAGKRAAEILEKILAFEKELKEKPSNILKKDGSSLSEASTASNNSHDGPLGSCSPPSGFSV